jgi:hypothetical protein
VDAEVAVGSFEHAFEVVEAERLVRGEGADDAEADTLVNEAVELREFWGARSVFARVVASALAESGLGTGMFAMWNSFSHRGSNLRAFGR